MRCPHQELDQLKQAALLRSLPEHPPGLANFASNDYLGLSRHPRIREAMHEAATHYGNGATASRLICGNSPPHRVLESQLAAAKNCEAALAFATGYATSVGVLTALLRKGDTVILDKLCHASLIDGARLSGATIRVFPHNHLNKLESLLRSTTEKAAPDSRTLVVTESVFSMDGDLAPLAPISTLCNQHQALLMVDEAHALGVLGPNGMGLAEQCQLQSKIDFHMGTLGKAAGVGGGYLAGRQVWIDLLVNKARSLIYSTAPPPAQAAAANQALQIIRSDEGAQLRQSLWNNIRLFSQASGLETSADSAIIPWMVGDSRDALALSERLKQSGLLVPAIRYPTVPRNTARLRITICAHHREEEILELAEQLT